MNKSASFSANIFHFFGPAPCQVLFYIVWITFTRIWRPPERQPEKDLGGEILAEKLFVLILQGPGGSLRVPSGPAVFMKTEKGFWYSVFERTTRNHIQTHTSMLLKVCGLDVCPLQFVLEQCKPILMFS